VFEEVLEQIDGVEPGVQSEDFSEAHALPEELDGLIGRDPPAHLRRGDLPFI
jgi:hypothetical protein